MVNRHFRHFTLWLYFDSLHWYTLWVHTHQEWWQTRETVETVWAGLNESLSFGRLRKIKILQSIPKPSFIIIHLTMITALGVFWNAVSLVCNYYRCIYRSRAANKLHNNEKQLLISLWVMIMIEEINLVYRMRRWWKNGLWHFKIIWWIE